MVADGTMALVGKLAMNGGVARTVGASVDGISAGTGCTVISGTGALLVFVTGLSGRVIGTLVGIIFRIGFEVGDFTFFGTGDKLGMPEGKFSNN